MLRGAPFGSPFVSRLSAAFLEIRAEGGLIFLALCGFALAPRGCEPQALVLVLKTKDGESLVGALCLALGGWRRLRLLGGSREWVQFSSGGNSGDAASPSVLSSSAVHHSNVKIPGG